MRPMPVDLKQWLAVAMSSALFCLSLFLIVVMLLAPIGSWLLVLLGVAVAYRLARDLRAASVELKQSTRLFDRPHTETSCDMSSKL